MTRIANYRAAVSAQHGRDTVFVSERSILTDRHVFASMLFQQKKLTALEWDLYVRWYDLLTEHMPVAGVVYLTTSVETCIERIKRRNRAGESVPAEYLADLHAAHVEWVDSTPLPVLRVSTEDGVTREEQVAQVRAFIDELRARDAPVAAGRPAPVTPKKIGPLRGSDEVDDPSAVLKATPLAPAAASAPEHVTIASP